jgi:hypothetical protein
LPIGPPVRLSDLISARTGRGPFINSALLKPGRVSLLEYLLLLQRKIYGINGILRASLSVFIFGELIVTIFAREAF